MKSLLFVSLPAVERDALPCELARIAAVSQRRNAEAGVTGALICTEMHFAWVLEGPRQAVDGIVASIRTDPCHAEMKVADEQEIDQSGFCGWKIAYSGPSLFSRKLCSPLFSEPTPLARANLRQFLKEMAR